MFEWKVEKMALMHGRMDVYVGQFNLNKTSIYTCESSVSREDKIAFVDKMQCGKLSYLLGLIKKFNEEKDSLPQNDLGSFGEKVKTVSLKAWLKRNDKKYLDPIIDNSYDYGKYNLLGCRGNIQRELDGPDNYYNDLVDEVFRRQLMECEKLEWKYFEEHDEYSILKKEFCDWRRKYINTTFGVYVWSCDDGRVMIGDTDDNERDITIEELKELLSKYEQLDAFIKKLADETHIVY